MPQKHDEDIHGTDINFKKNYKIRESVVVLAGRILVVQVVIFLLVLLAGVIFVAPEPSPDFTQPSFQSQETTESISAYSIAITSLYVINFLWVLGVLLVWYHRFYIISPREVFKARGVFLRRTATYHIKAMQAVRVHQGVLGRIFSFGTIELESPLLERHVYLKNVARPYVHAKIIEEQRMAELKQIPPEQIIPTVT